MAIKLPERNYFTFPELIERWECEESDIRRLIINGKLRPSYVINHVANIVRFREAEDSIEQYWEPLVVQNDSEHLSEKELKDYPDKLMTTNGFYYLLFPEQTAPLDCAFMYFSKDRNYIQGSEATCLMFTPGRKDWYPLKLTDVMKNGSVMMSEIALFESEGQESEDVSNGGSIEADIDPCDLPKELDLAKTAFRAVTNGHGDQSATFKNRLIEYLEKTFPNLKKNAVQRIATVANPDKTTGRKKRDKD